MIRAILCIGAVLATVLLVFSATAVAADYNRCAIYYNNPFVKGEDSGNKGWSRVKFRPWSPERFRRIPIKINWTDGNILPVYPPPEVIVNASSEGGREIVTYEYHIHPLELLESDRISHSDVPREQRAKIVVERHGGVMEITESQNFSAEELAEIRKKRSSGFIYAGTYTKFEILNGHCVPTESRDMFHTPDSEQLVETIVFDTRQCRSLHEFFRDNQAATELFSSTLNERAKELMQRNVQAPRDGFGEMPDRDVSERVLASQLPGEATYFVLRRDPASEALGRLRIFPVVLARMTLDNCLYQQLGPFLDDPRLWNDSSS